ncbi:MAG: hypothetical protein FWC46_01045 [Actinomycetia bacterium]|nr:hypothetical protein [Actinomycetes bacterium]
MSTTVRGMVLILVVGLVALLVATLADARTRRRLERERPSADDGLASPDYVTDDQLAASWNVRRAGPDDDRAGRVAARGTRLGLRLAASSLATLAGNRALLDDASVLVCRDEVESVREVLGVLQRASAAATPLVLAAPGFAGEVLDVLAANLRAGTLSCAALTGGDDDLAQLAALTGASVLGRTDLQADDAPPSSLGRAAHVLADARETWVALP